jgi:hypothetical protein
MGDRVSWHSVAMALIVVLIPFGWLYPLARLVHRVIARRPALEPVVVRRPSEHP